MGGDGRSWSGKRMGVGAGIIRLNVLKVSQDGSWGASGSERHKQGAGRCFSVPTTSEHKKLKQI